MWHFLFSDTWDTRFSKKALVVRSSLQLTLYMGLNGKTAGKEIGAPPQRVPRAFARRVRRATRSRQRSSRRRAQDEQLVRRAA